MSLTSNEDFYKTFAVNTVDSCRSVKEVVGCLNVAHEQAMNRLRVGNLPDAMHYMELEKVLFNEARRRGFFNGTYKSNSDSVVRHFDFDAAGGIRQ